MSHRRALCSAAFALFIPSLLAAAALSGCERTPAEAPGPETLSFAVVDSLLGPRIVVEEAGIALRTPDRFRSVEESTLVALREIGMPELPKHAATHEHLMDNTTVSAAFLDSTRQAGLAILVRRGVTQDDEVYAAAYEAALRDATPGSDVRYGEYVVNDVYVRNFLVSDESFVRFHLLCFGRREDAAELVYFASTASYPHLVRSFESSIGTITVAGKGG